MTLLGAALLSFFVGGASHWSASVLVQNWTSPPGRLEFWALFAIFFPAVTGFTQGVSMSGDLKDPGKSLPLGTFLAVGVSITVYFGVAFIFAGASSLDALATDYGAMKQVAAFAPLIDAGVIAATLSSGMASFLGAPRILQSLASDRVFPFLLIFAQGSGPAANPRRGVLLSAIIALATIALGSLNVIAPIVSMFFLVSYGLLNYATFFEARSSSPSFRPTFRWFDARLSLLGCLACLGVMLAINLTAGALAISVLFAIYQYLKRTAGPARWADSRRSYHLQRLREHLLAAAGEPEHPRYWRPQLLAFSDDSLHREKLLHFASWIEGGSGLTTAVRILEGEGPRMLKLQAEAEDELRKDIAQLGLKAFPLAFFAPSLEVGVQTLVQGFGIGPLKANLILLNWLDELPAGILGLRELKYAKNLRIAFRLGCNLVLLHVSEEEWTELAAIPPENRRIDVWWWDDATSRLVLLLAYLMTRSTAWDGARIRVLAPSYAGKSEPDMEALRQALEEVRIEAEAEVVPFASTDSLAANSGDASLVFLPFRLVDKQITGPFGAELKDLLPPLPAVAAVLAAQDIDLGAGPEEGQAGETAAALDSLADARKNAEDAEKDASKAAEDASAKQSELQAAMANGLDRETLESLESSAKEAQELAQKAFRRAAKTRAKAEDAAQALDELGVVAPQEEPASADSKEKES
jgi:hypothetical protein